MAKEEIVKVDEERTVNETATDTGDTGAVAGDTGGTPDPALPTAGNSSLGCDETPEVRAEREAMYLRQRALELASHGGVHEAKEPIAAVLARADAYRAYMETGETGIVA